MAQEHDTSPQSDRPMDEVELEKIHAQLPAEIDTRAPPESSPSSFLKTFRLYTFTLLISISSAVGSLVVFGLNPMTDTLSNLYEWSENEEKYYIGIINAFTLAGGFLGTVCATFWLKKAGRWTLTVIFEIFIIGFGVALCMIESIYALIIGRFVVGYGTSLVVYICPPFLREMAPTRVRGFIGAFHQLQFATGTAAAYAFGLVLPEPEEENRGDGSWRIVLAGPAILGIPQAILMIACFWGYESPKYLYLKGKEDEARHVLEKIQSPSEIAETMNSLTLTRGGTQKKILWKDLRQPHYYRPLLLAMIVMGAFHACGTASILAYSTDIFSSVDSSQSLHDSIMATFLYVGITNTVSTIIGLFTVAKFKRRHLALIGMLALSVCSVFIAVFDLQDNLFAVKMSILCFITAFETGFGILGFSYQAEILEPELLIWPRYIHWAVLITVGLITKPVISEFGLSTLYFGYAILDVIFFCIFWRYMVETSGLKTEEIREKFDKGIRQEF